MSFQMAAEILSQFFNGSKNSSQDRALGVLRLSWLVNGDDKTGMHSICCCLLGIIYRFSVNPQDPLLL